MPFERVFSYGEVLRNGVDPDANLTPFRMISFVVIGLAALGPFAPIYWIRLARNSKRRSTKDEPAPSHD